ncbi:MAG: YbaN family protein [Bryobacteraceae bacterium]
MSVKSTRLSKCIYGGLGWCAVAFGFAGILVPGLPTTVFIIGASYFFARSSPRFDAWLRANRLFGPPLQRFHDTGGMTRSAKATALASMWTAITISSLALAAVGATGPLVAIALGGIGTAAIHFGVRTVPQST